MTILARTPSRRLVAALAAAALLGSGACRPGGGGGGGADEVAAPADPDRPRDAQPTTHGWVWTVPAPAWAGMPAADAKGVAVTFGHRRLVLLDGSGRVQWVADRLGLREVAPRLTAELVLAATDEGVAAFRRSGGTAAWDTEVAGRANTPVVAGAMVVTSTWEGDVVGLDRAGGAVAWRARVPGSSLGPPASDGKVVVVTWDGSRPEDGGAAAFDAASGRQIWSVRLPGGGVSAPAVLEGGSTVVVAGDRAAHSLSTESGATRWRTPLAGAGSPEVPPAAAGKGEVLVVHRLAGLDLLETGTGRRIWQVDADGAAVRGAPAVGPQGSVALNLDDGRVVVAGPRRPVETVEPDGRFSGVAVGPGGLLVGATREGQVSLVEATRAW